jgi:epoxyqueuosine reductase
MDWKEHSEVKMLPELTNITKQNGDKFAVVSIENVRILQDELARFREEHESELNETQKWALGRSSFKGIPKDTRSVIIIAVPDSNSLDEARLYVEETIKTAGFSAKEIKKVPLKRLAVQSGLAEYGRHNITCVEGMGSYLLLAAFATNAILEEAYAWREPMASPLCKDCDLCLANCRTGAIDKDRFLLDSEKCKKCGRCRAVCPMNN